MPVPVTIVYDGHCPFCSAYARLVRLRDAVGPVELVDARTSEAWRARLADLGVDLNAGFAVAQGARLLTGAEALAFVARADRADRLFGRLNRALFARPAMARAAYPLLRSGRALTLRLLRRKPF